MTADPKPAPRVVDRKASKRKLLLDPWCRSCPSRATNCHHLVGKGQRGDDVDDNLIPLCGSGTTGCHGALHGTPSTHQGRRRTARDVRLAIGLKIHPSEYGYVLGKLSAADGDLEPGRQYLRDRYYVEAATLQPFVLREVK